MGKRALPEITVRELTTALGLIGVGALGALPLAQGSSSLMVLAWIAVSAAALGALAGGTSMHALIVAPAIPVGWALVLTLVDASQERGLPTPVWSVLAWSGLFAAGFGLGRLVPGSARGVAALLALASALALGLPQGGGLVQRTWDPQTSALLLDFSPLTLLAECAGLDWMRHPSVYEGAGTMDIDPSVRSAYRGILAGPMVLLVGCTAAITGELARRRRAQRSSPSPSLTG